MRAAVALGARLAWGSPGRRARSLAVLATSAVGTAVLLTVWAVAHGRMGGTAAFDDQEVGRLMAAVVGAVALPVFVLAATVGRLSAQLRDRRLANLRLLGLSAGQTRAVAAAEAGLVAAAGTAAGAVLTLVLWPLTGYAPPPPAWAVVAVGMPVVTTAVAVLPQGLDPRRAVERARRADARRPSPWRAAPLAAGLVVCLLVRRANDDFVITDVEVTVLLTGIGLVAVGIVAIVPVFVRLVADLLLRTFSGPTATLAARRLQAQPAAATRVIAALMVGLFLVIGARAVLVAFEETSQYVAAADHVENGQRAAVTVPGDRLDDAHRQVEAIDGVRETFAFPVLTGTVEIPGWGGEPFPITALVATCDELRAFAPAVPDCVDGRVSALVSQWVHDQDPPETAALQAVSDGVPVGEPVEVAVDGPQVIGSDRAHSGQPNWDLRPLWADLLVPPGTPGVEAALAGTDTTLVVLAEPGHDLYEQLETAGLAPSTHTDLEYYDFVGDLRAVVWTLAAVVLSIGLLTFAVAAVDRAVARRRELVSLRLVGTPPGVLRRAQWLEAALPTGLGCVAAIVSGLFAGSTYLQLGTDMGEAPWRQGVLLMGAAVVAAAIIAALTVVGTSSRLVADHIRQE
ncbi:FtsX-like permease family protein [Jiangella ureilytica]|uniref:FtsX-like permease family protein n=1 Tax=Jiangella ureilytica TaxID=2530374 RepID=A0A4R4S2M0_9ACTN|nr:FtsX-like permease family protein [Jiangella ureilytica]TDC57038.1 FtsX-like permease family protein [Jiangella ureilytica]